MKLYDEECVNKFFDSFNEACDGPGDGSGTGSGIPKRDGSGPGKGKGMGKKKFKFKNLKKFGKEKETEEVADEVKPDKPKTKSSAADYLTKNEEQSIDEAIKVPKKQQRNVKRKKRIGIKKAHRGTNWDTLKPKAGYKRTKVGSKYVRTRMTTTEKRTRKKVGSIVGKRKF